MRVCLLCCPASEVLGLSKDVSCVIFWCLDSELSLSISIGACLTIFGLILFVSDDFGDGVGGAFFLSETDSDVVSWPSSVS